MRIRAVLVVWVVLLVPNAPDAAVDAARAWALREPGRAADANDVRLLRGVVVAVLVGGERATACVTSGRGVCESRGGNAGAVAAAWKERWALTRPSSVPMDGEVAARLLL